MPDQPQEGGGWFPTTNWSLVGHAGDQLDQQQSTALDELLRAYWPALRAHLVYRRRLDPHDADDLVQGFIENKILERDLVSVAEKGRGRFRSLLMTALENYVANQMQRKFAKKRAAESAVPVDPKDGEAWVAENATPDRAFEVQWARQVLDQAISQMEEQCRATQRDELWGVFDGRILAPLREGAEPLDYDLLVERFGFRSPTQASNALITAKRMFARTLRSIVSQYAFDEQDVEAEIVELQRCLSQSGL